MSEELMAAFARVLRAERDAAAAQTALTEVTNRYRTTVAEAETRLAQSWAEVQAYLAETGEYEVTLPGSSNDYKIVWNTPRTRVVAEDVNALPEEYVRIKREPMLKEIGALLAALEADGKPFPNWARLEKGPRSLTWKPVKHKASA